MARHKEATMANKTNNFTDSQTEYVLETSTAEMQIPDEDTLFDLAELYKIFGDSSRVKILFSLLSREMSVNDIADELSMTQSAISHQLRILKTNRLVKYRREGKSLIYTLADEHVTQILQLGVEHLLELK